MNFYPAYLDLRDRPCLVVGGGAVAERKTLSLLEAGAVVTVISPTLTPKLQDLSRSGKITHVQRVFEDRDVASVLLVFAATDSPSTNSAVARVCRNRHVLVNVAAPPEESSFIVPSVVERGRLLIAVSTCGASPALAKRVRQDLEQRYGTEYDRFLERAAAARERVLSEVADGEQRRRILQQLVDSDVIELLRQGRDHEADARIAGITGSASRTDGAG